MSNDSFSTKIRVSFVREREREEVKDDNFNKNVFALNADSSLSWESEFYVWPIYFCGVPSDFSIRYNSIVTIVIFAKFKLKSLHFKK